MTSNPASDAMLLAVGSDGSAVSKEAETLRRFATAIVESRDVAFSILPSVVERAAHFVCSLPADYPLPEVAPEPDGALSFDWIASKVRAFSVGVGATQQLSFAWIDGANRGHGVAWFQHGPLPRRVIEGIRDVFR